MAQSRGDAGNQGCPRMTGADALMDALRRHGVDTIFGYPGGAILPIAYCGLLTNLSLIFEGMPISLGYPMALWS